MKDFYVIQDTITGLYLTAYSTNPDNCMWGNEANALQFTEEQAGAITGVLGLRFIGKNPKPR